MYPPPAAAWVSLLIKAILIGFMGWGFWKAVDTIFKAYKRSVNIIFTILVIVLFGLLWAFWGVVDFQYM